MQRNTIRLTRPGRRPGVGLAAMLVASLCAATAARAQDKAADVAQDHSPITIFLRGLLADDPPATPAAPDANAPSSDPNAATADDSGINWSVLDPAPPSYEDEASVKALRSPDKPATPPPLDVSRTDQPDGSSSMTLNRPLPTVWDTKVGADVSLAAPPPTTYEPGGPLPNAVSGDNGGAAWVSTNAPGVGTIGARVDANPDQRKFGTTFERTVPLGQALSVTVHGAYAVTDADGEQAITGSAPVAPSRVIDSEKLIKFKFLSTGTTLGAGVTTTTTDPGTHHRLVAEQELYGPLHVTGTVTDMGEADSSKSITAGFNFKW
jgi:hypothetical protein